MSISDFNAIFSKNLRRRLEISGMTQAELARKLGVGTTSVSNWCKGTKVPRMDKVDAMCAIFSCRRSNLMEDRDVRVDGQPEYYTESITAGEAQEMFEDKVMRSLYHIKKNMDPDKFRVHYDTVKQLYLLEHPEEHPEDFE